MQNSVYKIITMKRNNRKKYKYIDRETDRNETSAMLDKTESEAESDIANLLENSDTEFTEESIRAIRRKSSTSNTKSNNPC